MKIHHSKSWQPYQPGRKQLPIRHNYDAVRLKFLKKSASAVVFQRRRLVDRQLKFECALPHWRRMHLLSTAAWLIGLSYDSNDVITVAYQSLKGWNRKLCSPHVNHAEILRLGIRHPVGDRYGSHSPCFTSLRILRLMRSRLRKLR